jgi:hypothetical protein
MDETTTSTNVKTQPVTLEKLEQVQRDLESERLNHLRDLFTGVRVYQDATGMMVGPNDYCIFVGAKLYEKLKAQGAK